VPAVRTTGLPNTHSLHTHLSVGSGGEEHVCVAGRLNNRADHLTDLRVPNPELLQAPPPAVQALFSSRSVYGWEGQAATCRQTTSAAMATISCATSRSRGVYTAGCVTSRPSDVWL
jgi:hypothetical protein